MKTVRFFWGTFFVVVGALLLLSNLEYINIDWSSTWKLWPLILVLWGLSKFTDNRGIRAIFAVLNGLIFACIVFGFFSFQWFTGPFDETEAPRYTQHLSEPYDSSIERASFRFSGGAGTFVMRTTTENLVDAQTQSGFGEYELDKSEENGTADVSLQMRDRRRFRFFGRIRNQADIQLNTKPNWEMRFNAGASRLDLDLTPYKTEQVTIDAGVTTIRLRLGERTDEINLHVKTGVSSVRIEVPSSSGCEIYDNAHVGSTHFDDFSSVGGDRWQTDNYSNASKKIFITIDAGVSSVRVKKY